MNRLGLDSFVESSDHGGLRIHHVHDAALVDVSEQPGGQRRIHASARVGSLCNRTTNAGLEEATHKCGLLEPYLWPYLLGIVQVDECERARRNTRDLLVALVFQRAHADVFVVLLLGALGEDALLVQQSEQLAHHGMQALLAAWQQFMTEIGCPGHGVAGNLDPGTSWSLEHAASPTVDRLANDQLRPVRSVLLHDHREPVRAHTHLGSASRRHHYRGWRRRP